MANIVTNICEKHHYRFYGTRCPMCESERIDAMVRKYVKEEKKEVEEAPANLDWNDLAGKFIINAR